MAELILVRRLSLIGWRGEKRAVSDSSRVFFAGVLARLGRSEWFGPGRKELNACYSANQLFSKTTVYFKKMGADKNRANYINN